MTTQENTIVSVETFLPIFNGFYGSVWESVIDGDVENEIDYYNNECGKNVEYDDLEIDYTTMYADLSQSINDVVENVLKDLNMVSAIKYEKLVSPKYYNFSNDSINTTIEFSQDNINTIKEYIKENYEQWSDFLKEKFTSRSGFISHYSNYPENDEWQLDNIFNEQSNNIGFVLEFIAQNEEITEIELYYDVEFYVGEYITINEDEDKEDE